MKSPQNEGKSVQYKRILGKPRTAYQDDNIQCRQKAGSVLGR